MEQLHVLLIATTYNWCLIPPSHPFRNLCLWLLANGGEKNGTHSSLCALNQANVGWVTLSNIQAMSSRLTTYSFLEYANSQLSWPTNPSNRLLCIFDKMAFFLLCCQSTSSRRFKMYGQIAVLAYNDHRSSFPMLLTIRHSCSMHHRQAWCPLFFKPEETINPN
jgi:hypothetical protein